METTNVTRPKQVAGVRFEKCGKAYHFDCSAFQDLQVNDFVIVETSRGRQMGRVVSLVEPGTDTRENKPILRMATPQDLVGQQIWQAKAGEVLAMCRQKAARLGAKHVKFIQARYNFDGSLLTITYNAEDRINTNRLRSALRRTFRTKIEFRQVGPRDVAKTLEGCGACGIVRCCVDFLTEFSPISIKMAKAQNISLNPSEITGVCGRLRCCLAYEYEQYREALKGLPKKGKWVETPHGPGKVIDLLPLEEAAVVLVENMRHVVPRDAMSARPKPQPKPDADTDGDEDSGRGRERDRGKKRRRR